MCMDILPVSMCIGCPKKPEDGNRLAGTVVTDGCELLPCECWKLNPDPLGKQLALLSIEPFLHSLVVSVFK